MKIENSFTVDATPDRVFAYLLDLDQVVGCIPGATLEEVVDSKTFRGTLKVKVGPVQMTYRGTARLLEVEENEDQGSATARVEGDARDVRGADSVRGSMALTVAADGEGTKVDMSADVNVTGRVSQFGRGMVEDVSRRLVRQMAACLQDRLAADGGGGA